MRDRSMRSGTELAQDIKLTDWSRAREHVKNLSNQFSGVQISCDICTRFGRYLYSTKQCWIIKTIIDMDEAFVILTETLIILDITKTESSNCFIINH